MIFILRRVAGARPYTFVAAFLTKLFSSEARPSVYRPAGPIALRPPWYKSCSIPWGHPVFKKGLA
jgi:hypothetical protein